MTPWVSFLLIANVAIWVLEQAVPGLWRMLALVPAWLLVRPWTLITYMFVHDPVSITHLLFNMIALYFFGPQLERRLGSASFLGLYLTSGVVGGLLSWVMPGNPMVPIVGASGAIFGVQLGFARYWPRERIYIWGVVPIEARVLVVVMTVLSLWGGFGGSSGGVAHFAHLGGFVGGWLYLAVRDRRSPARRFRARATTLETASAGTDLSDLRRWEAIPRDELHVINREEVERLLAKARATGPGSLTPSERATLNRFSER
ncbi:MAG TPA: rhomboid family intramembrane serine protease [Gemmatimonadaceae bacterium]|nr:rhomboid family intramembrane serine protease [Gemmatimonadaceae bacterium]